MSRSATSRSIGTPHRSYKIPGKALLLWSPLQKPDPSRYSCNSSRCWILGHGHLRGQRHAPRLRRARTPDGEDLEVKRWRWYQCYYDAVTDNPIGPLWKALPDPVDFFAETPPAKDPSVPDELYEDSENARRHFYLLSSLGVWLAHLPVRVSTLITFIVMYVRRRENYGNKIQNWFLFYWNAFIGVLGIIFHLVRRPQWVWERSFESNPRRKGVRRLFGWATYLLALRFFPVLVLLTIGAALFLHWILHWIAMPDWLRWVLVPLLFAGLFFLIDQIVRALILASGKPKSKNWLTRMLAGWPAKVFSHNLGIAHGLLHSYEIKRAIYDLFVKGAPDYVKKGPGAGAVKALPVCAALEEVDQVILEDHMPIMEALTAAIAVPALLSPQKVPKEWIANQTETHPDFFRIIDGATVRTNPLPALFEWLKRIDKSDISTRLESKDLSTAKLHVVYNVPTGYAGSVQDAPGMECPDIVLSAQKALQLARRRDTRQEVRQTNTLSRLEWHRRLIFPGTRRAFVVMADEIAPREEIDLGNELSPEGDSLRRIVADGCRAALETLYHEQIRALGGEDGKVHCLQLIRAIAPRRANAVTECSGLRSVCDRCTRQLEHRPPHKPDVAQDGLLRTYGLPEEPHKEELKELFPQLAEQPDEKMPNDRRARVTFLGSGGVFRGAFHIGVLAAMYEAELYPDLVIGASVGTLMGGALCRMTASEPKTAPQVLADLTKLFTNVDKKVALTFTLKNAAKQLAIRARCIRLSPADLARKIEQGSKGRPRLCSHRRAARPHRCALLAVHHSAPQYFRDHFGICRRSLQFRHRAVPERNQARKAAQLRHPPVRDGRLAPGRRSQASACLLRRWRRVEERAALSMHNAFGTQGRLLRHDILPHREHFALAGPRLPHDRRHLERDAGRALLQRISRGLRRAPRIRADARRGKERPVLRRRRNVR
jgi:predicted acylesterase/phospholipase RssA